MRPSGDAFRGRLLDKGFTCPTSLRSAEKGGHVKHYAAAAFFGRFSCTNKVDSAAAVMPGIRFA